MAQPDTIAHSPWVRTTQTANIISGAFSTAGVQTMAWHAPATHSEPAAQAGSQATATGSQLVATHSKPVSHGGSHVAATGSQVPATHSKPLSHGSASLHSGALPWHAAGTVSEVL